MKKTLTFIFTIVIFQAAIMADDNAAQSIYHNRADNSFKQFQNFLKYISKNNQTADEQLEAIVKAGVEGIPVAQYSIGVIFYNGMLKTPRDYTKALEWFKKSAEQGFAVAQLSVGECYMLGQGTSKDYNQAKKWLRKAAKQGNKDAIKILQKIDK